MSVFRTAIDKVSRLRSMPPRVAAEKIAGKCRRGLCEWRSRRVDRRRASYSLAPPAGELYRYFPPPEAAGLRAQRPAISATVAHYLDHRFDLLGSGWVQVRHGMHCFGVEGVRYDSGVAIRPDSREQWLQGRINAPNLAEAQRIWRMLDRNYLPIDWHLDFKSGFRWREDVWYRDSRALSQGQPGVDIKVPWELSRMQHLSQLAAAACLAEKGEPGFAEPERYSREFRNQILDFIATNPPRFGVNWSCTMDVAIRIANWLVAYDLFRGMGVTFDPAFEEVFRRSLVEHGRHIIGNLEWSPELHGNHYLADIVGLLFVAAYLPRSAESDVWLAFAVQELIKEVDGQFGDDGGNFEGSTCYHRLSAELVAYGTALVLGLPEEKKEALGSYEATQHRHVPPLAPAPLPLYPMDDGIECPFSPGYVEKLGKIADFARRMARPDGRAPQFGDNDSGRFLKLFPVFQNMTVAEAKGAFLNLAQYSALPDDGLFWLEDGMNHQHLEGALEALLGRDGSDCWSAGMERRMVRGVAKGWRLQAGAEKETKVRDLEVGGPFCFHDFGLFVYRLGEVYCAVRCGPVGQNGWGGHAHDDQLSFELFFDGVPFIVDPGTYLYTPLPAQRREFRSARVHSTLALRGKTQNGSEAGDLFRLFERAHARVRQCTPGMIEMEHGGFGLPHRRAMGLTSEAITIADHYAGPEEKKLHFSLAPGVRAELMEGGVLLSRDGKRLRLLSDHGRWGLLQGAFSRGYGWVEEAARVVLIVDQKRQAWEIDIQLGGGTQ